MAVDLDKLVEGIEDVTDPSSMDKVLEYAERIQDNDDNFIQLLTERVHNADIYWEIPWYQEHRNLRLNGSLAANNESVAFRTDTISQAEHEIIARNWSKFRKKYKVPDQIISLARWKNRTKSRNPNRCPEEKARRFAASYLARGLERTTAQVYRHIIAYYGGYTKGLYSDSEQKIIEICFHHQPKSLGTILSLVLGREPRGVYKRLHHLSNGKPEVKKLKWNLRMASKLLQHILKYTEKELKDLKNKQIETWVWRRIEEDMNRSSSQLQDFWYCYLHVQLFVREDVTLNRLRKKVFKKLREKIENANYKVWTDIRWKNIVPEFPDGFTARFINRACNCHVKTLKGYLRKPLENVIEYALQKLKKFKRKRKNKRLKKLRLNEEGLLELV